MESSEGVGRKSESGRESERCKEEEMEKRRAWCVR